MAYTLAKSRATPGTNLAGLTASASSRLALTGFIDCFDHGATASAMRATVQRVTGGVTPTNQTPEKTNPLSPAAGATGTLSWSTAPTASGNPLLVFGRSEGTVGADDPRSWRPPNPNLPILLNPSAIICVFHLPGDGGTPAWGHNFDEPDRIHPPRQSRRGRRRGLGFYADQANILPAVATQPFRQSTVASAAYLQDADWPRTESVVASLALQGGTAGDVSVSNDTGLATADGGASTLTVGFTNAAGAATAGGGTSSLTVALTNTGGTATAGGGTSATARTLTNASGTATASGGTSALTATYANAAGTATAGGGTQTLAVTVSAAGGLATAAGGTSALAVTYANTGGTAAAGGGTTSLTFAYGTSAGGATAGGGTSTVSIVSGVTVTNITGTATAGGGVSTLAVTITALTGTATAGGGSSSVTVIAAAGGFSRIVSTPTGGFTYAGTDDGPDWSRVVSTGPAASRVDPGHDNGFERLSDDVDTGFTRV